MAVLRFLSALFFLAAVVAVSLDAMPMTLGTGGFEAASLDARVRDVAPSLLVKAQSGLEGLGAGPVWTLVFAPLLSLPAFAVLALLGMLLGYLGRRRYRIRVFAN